jgi:hypothetical protein
MIRSSCITNVKSLESSTCVDKHWTKTLYESCPTLSHTSRTHHYIVLMCTLPFTPSSVVFLHGRFDSSARDCNGSAPSSFCLHQLPYSWCWARKTPFVIFRLARFSILNPHAQMSHQPLIVLFTFRCLYCISGNAHLFSLALASLVKYKVGSASASSINISFYVSLPPHGSLYAHFVPLLKREGIIR